MDVNLIIIVHKSQHFPGEAVYSFVNKPSSPRQPRKFGPKCIHTMTRLDPESGEMVNVGCRNEVARGRANGFLCGYHDSLAFPVVKMDPMELRKINSGWIGNVKEDVQPSPEELEVLEELLRTEDDDPVGYGHGV